MAAAKRVRGSKKTEPETRLLDSALELAALQGWNNTSMAEIADAAGLDLAGTRAVFASKQALLARLFGRIDEDMLRDLADEGGGEPVRDRLFDIIMRRFDAMAPHKAGIHAIVSDLIRDPPALACLAAGPLRRTLEWMLMGAKVDSWGPLRGLQLKGLGLIYAGALRAWFRDDSPDLAGTMAALDKGLGRAEAILRMLPLAGATGAGEADDASAEA